MAITKTYFATSSQAASAADNDYIVIQQGTGSSGTGALSEMKKTTVKALRQPLYDTIDNASLPQVGGSGKFISAISQSSGAVSAIEASFITEMAVGNNESETVPPTEHAIVEFVREQSANGIISNAIASAVNALDVSSIGATGAYIKTISEADGKISATTENFDSSITNNTGNAPTSQAVKTYVDNKVSVITGSIGDGSTLIKSISQTSGAITGVTVAIDQNIEGDGVPSTTAVKAAITGLTGSVGNATGATTLLKSISETDGKITGTTIELTGTVTNNSGAVPTSQAVYLDNRGALLTALGALELTEVGQDGYYIKKVSQTDGQLAAVKQKFDTFTLNAGNTSGQWKNGNDNINPDDTNVPTSLAVKSYVDAASQAIKNRIDSLDYDYSSSATGAGDGYFINQVNQTDGKITTIKTKFENGTLVNYNNASYASNASVAPTVRAVTEQVKRLDDRISVANSDLASLTAGPFGAAGAFIDMVRQNTGGVLNASSKTFLTSVPTGIDANATGASVPATANAVRAAINELTKGATGATGSYIKFVEENTGVISATAAAFDTSITNNTGNAPTSKAVKDYVDAECEKVLEQSEAMTYLGAVSSKKDIEDKASTASKATRPLYDIGDTFIANADFNLNGDAQEPFNVRSGDMIIVGSSAASYYPENFDIISGSQNTIMFASQAAVVDQFPVFSTTDGRSLKPSGESIATLSSRQNAASTSAYRSSSSASQAEWWAGKASSSASWASSQAQPYVDDASRSATYASSYAATASSKATYSASQATFASSQATYASSQATYASNRASYSASQATYASSQATYASSQATYASNRASYSASQATYASNRASYSASQATFASSQATYASNRASYSASQATFASSQATYASSQATFASSQATYASNRASYSASQATFASSRATYASSQATYSASQATFASSQATYASSQATFASSKATYSASQATFASSQATYAASRAADADQSAAHAHDADVTISTYAAAQNLEDVRRDCVNSASYASSSATLASNIVVDCVRKTGAAGAQKVQTEFQVGTSSAANFDVTTTGSVTAYDFNAVSSRKLKENIRPTIISALDLIDKVEIVDYNYIADDEKKPHIGFIAEDTNPIFSTPHMNSMDYTNCIGALFKAVQEITKGMEKLEKRFEER